MNDDKAHIGPKVLPEPVDESLTDADIALDLRLQMFRLQHQMRQLEKRAHDLFLKGLVKGTSHLSLGMEAVAAGFGAAMRSDDWTFATYRGHAHTIARGVPLGPILAELCGRDNGLCRGKGGSMHLHERRAQHDGQLRHYRRPPVRRQRCRLVSHKCVAPTRWQWPSSATGPPTSVRSTKR